MSDVTPAVRLEQLIDGADVSGAPANRLEALIMGEDIEPATRIEALIKNAISSGDGGGLESEEGLYAPTSNSKEPTISFTNQHQTAPSIIVMSDATGDGSIVTSAYYEFAFIAEGLLFGERLPFSAGTLKEGSVFGWYVVASGTFLKNYGLNILATSDVPSYAPYVWNTGFAPHGAGSTIYWKAGRTYKWLALWI